MLLAAASRVCRPRLISPTRISSDAKGVGGILGAAYIESALCQGCGNCVLHLTGGICPVSRCPKSLFNGPCGGSQRGICEVDRETECAWHLICENQIRLGLFEEMMQVQPAKDWSSARDGGHRKIVREDVRIPDVEKA